LTEIPITILPTLMPLNRNHGISRYYFRNVNSIFALKVLRKVFYANQPVWLRPTPEMTAGLLETLVSEAERINLPYITMMFHSSELMPGCSKYRPDKQSVEDLYALLTTFFTFLESSGIGSVTLTEAAKEWKS